jgi:phospholipid-binding lipoprotein MlaA
VRRTIFATAAGVVLLNSAPAHAADSAAPSNDDPWERLNRRFYSFSQGLDRAIIRPAAMGYVRIAPKPFRLVIRNFLSNLGEPKVIVNDILQLRPKRTIEATGRFLVNSTVGLGGILDVATHTNLPHRDNGFSVTLGHYGVGSGPYIYVPITGPATVRSLIGSIADGVASPLYWIRYPGRTEVSISLGLVHGLDLRAEVDSSLKSLTADATDPYATIRSAYLQNQQSLVNGDSDHVQSLPDFDDSATPAPSAPAAPPATPAPPPGGDTAAPGKATPPASDAPPPAPAPSAPAPTPNNADAS